MHRSILPPTLVLAVASALLVVAPASARAGAGDSDQPVVAVSGTLLQTAKEPHSGGPYFAVRLADGDIVPIEADFASTPKPLSRFSGTLEVPEQVQSTLDARGDALAGRQRISATSATGREVLALVDRSAETMQVADATLTAPAPESTPVTSTTHRVFVAVPENLGHKSNRSDATVRAWLGRDAAYWKGQSGGQIAGISVPTTVRHYNSAVMARSRTCGFGEDFYAALDEAAALFPGFTPATDHLVVGLPQGDCDGQVLGIGTVGAGFQSGGGLIASFAPSDAVGTVAHEMGHNYGFQHSTVVCGVDCYDEYYGIYDVMGFGLGTANQLTALSTGYRQLNGVEAPGEVDRTDVGDGQITRRISPRSATSGLRSIVVTDPSDESTYFVDYRSGGGTDAGAAYASEPVLTDDDGSHAWRYSRGVVVHQAYSLENADGTTEGTGGVDVVPVGDRTSTRPGQEWTSPSGNLTLSVSRMSATSATVTVSTTAARSETPITPAPDPAVTGFPKVGSILTAVAGDWDPGASLDFAWKDSSGAVLSESRTWTPAASTLGKRVSVTVSGIRDGFAATSRTSAPVTVASGSLTTAVPRISGTARVGSRLTVARGTWTSGTTLSQTWYTGTRRLSSATSITPSRSLRGKRVYVKVTGRKAGYATVTRTSPVTAKIR